MPWPGLSSALIAVLHQWRRQFFSRRARTRYRGDRRRSACRGGASRTWYSDGRAVRGALQTHLRATFDGDIVELATLNQLDAKVLDGSEFGVPRRVQGYLSELEPESVLSVCRRCVSVGILITLGLF